VAVSNQIADAAKLLEKTKIKRRYRFWISNFLKEGNFPNFLAYFRALDSGLSKYF
jgi:hypothetical protein